MIKIKNILIIIIILAFVGCDCKQKINQKEFIRIGAILPLTGDAAQAGLNTKQGIDLAIELVNNNGGV